MSEPATEVGELEALLGTTLAERYRIDDVLGVGGMGAVFRARHLLLKRDVAVKVLHPSLSTNDDLSRRFDREAQSAARLDHPNVIPVSEFGSTDAGMKYMVMPVLQGTELADLIEGPMDPMRAIELEIQILRGLEHAHQNGVVHRDLKPENVFVTRDHEDEEILKLVDFGIAKLLTEDEDEDEDGEGAQPLTRMGLIFGTPHYMSPEQATGSEIDARTDIYSAGVILYQMLSGHVPFDSEDPVAITRMQVTVDPPPLPEQVPQELQQVVAGMMAKTRKERYPDARTARKALQQVQERLAGQQGIVLKYSPHDTGVVDPRDIYPPGHEALRNNPAFASSSGSGSSPQLGPGATYNPAEYSASDPSLSPTMSPSESTVPPVEPLGGSSSGNKRATMSLADALTSAHPTLQDKPSPIAAMLARVPKPYQYAAGGVFALLLIIALWPSGDKDDEGEGETGDSAGVAVASDSGEVEPKPVETKVTEAKLDEIDKVLSSKNADESLRMIQPELDQYPDDPQLNWRYGKAMSFKKAKSDRVIALDHYGQAYEGDPTLVQNPEFYAELYALLENTQLREQAINLAVQKLGKDGHKFLIELVNNQKRSLGWFDRHRVLDALSEDPEAAGRVDWKLNMRRDLEKAEHAPKPCAAFVEALDAIADSKDEYFVDAIFTVKPPPAPADDPEDAQQCEAHEGKLEAIRDLMTLTHPEAAAKYQKKRKKKKK